MFWTGFLVGCVIGGLVGFLTMAVCRNVPDYEIAIAEEEIARRAAALAALAAKHHHRPQPHRGHSPVHKARRRARR